MHVVDAVRGEKRHTDGTKATGTGAMEQGELRRRCDCRPAPGGVVGVIGPGGEAPSRKNI